MRAAECIVHKLLQMMPNRAPAVESMQCIDTGMCQVGQELFREVLQRVEPLAIKGILCCGALSERFEVGFDRTPRFRAVSTGKPETSSRYSSGQTSTSVLRGSFPPLTPYSPSFPRVYRIHGPVLDPCPSSTPNAVFHPFSDSVQTS